MSNRARILQSAAQFRHALQTHYEGYGDDFGYRLARRAIVEFASCVADNHCREDAVELLYRVADQMAGPMVSPLGATLLPGEELMPGPRAALAAVEAPPEPEPPALTFAMPNGIGTITGDLHEARAGMLAALAQIDELLPPEPEPEPEPAPPPTWRARLGGLVTWREVAFWALGFAMGGGFQ